MKREDIAGLALLIILVIAFIIRLLRELFPYFLLGSIILLIILIVSWFLYQNDYLDDTGFYIIGGIFLFFVAGTVLSFAIGYGFGESSVGRAITELADAFNVFEETKTNATLVAIDESQRATSEIISSLNSTDSENLGKSINTSYDVMRVVVKN
jgi:energy-coupling factor transporter transmembrane protein EcfT